MCAGAAALAVAAVGCGAGSQAGGGGGGANPSSIARVQGTYRLMRFAGGPPAPGQITDTTEIDVDTRRVTIRREVTGGAPGSCELTAPDDAAWHDLIAAFADAGLASALANPDRIPRLPLDAGYFQCTRGAVTVAVSDIKRGDAESPLETAAIRNLQSAYERAHAAWTQTASCSALR